MAKRRKSSPLKPLIIIALIAGVVYGAPRAYFSYELNQALSRITTNTNPFVDLSYDSAWADFMGENATIHDIAIDIESLDDGITVDELRVHAGGYGALGRLSNGRRMETMPESLALEVRGLRFEVGDPIYDKLINSAASQNGQQTALERIDAVACDNPDRLMDKIVQELDLDELVIDGRLRMGLDQASREFQPSGFLDIQDFARMEIDATVVADGSGADALPLGGPDALRRAASLKLSKLRFRFKDQGANRARNQICAQRLDSDVADFVERHVAGIGDLMARSGERAPDFLKHYRQYVEHGGDYEITMQPGEPLSFRDMSQFTREISVFRLRPELEINGRSISEGAALWLSELAVTPANEIAWGDGAEPTATAGEQPDEADSGDDGLEQGDTRRAVDPANLDEFVGYRARITTDDGKTYSGRIASVDDQKVTVHSGMEGGYVGYGIDQNTISEARVSR